MKTLISRLLLKLRQRHPFLATIMMFSEYRFSQATEHFSTNGKVIDINHEYFKNLTPEQQAGVLLHTCLHCALLHPSRKKERETLKWNAASDIVVNNILDDIPSVEIPNGTAHNLNFQELSVEQVYEQLETCPASELNQLCQICVNQNNQGNYPALIQDLTQSDNSPDQLKKITTFWKRAVTQARTSSGSKHHGCGHLGLLREIGAIEEPQIDWRTHLWRFMSLTPCDFSGFDRRLIHQGLYLEELLADSLNIIMAIDTSGSVGDQELTTFMSETKAIMHAYPHIKVMLYFIDDEMVGPYILNDNTELPAATGGGGTDFHVFFEELKTQDQFMPQLCLYLTDGYADFPEQGPDIPLLWVVTPGGAETREFPFGEVARLSF